MILLVPGFATLLLWENLCKTVTITSLDSGLSLITTDFTTT
jgi:hypothetical protein